jgi:hypothetical protein
VTFHEMLAVLNVAQAAHAKPDEEGRHNEPTLNPHCVLAALREYAKLLGFPPGHLLAQFKLKFPVLVKKGWVVICDVRCGSGHFVLTETGRDQLEEWNTKGCIAHVEGFGKKAGWRGCAAPDVIKASAKRRSPYGSESGA